MEYEEFGTALPLNQIVEFCMERQTELEMQNIGDFTNHVSKLMNVYLEWQAPTIKPIQRVQVLASLLAMEIIKF
jgi:hypothetical protein